MSRYINSWNASAASCDELDRAEFPDASENCCPAGIWLGGLEQKFAYVIPFLLFLCWVFSGVALGSEVFMTAIEVITSKEKTTTVTVDGVTKKFHTSVWNPTVANLTLMALGSSAPEILLNIVEILTGDFYAGSLGPSTIVGSAAFNLMCITAVCIVCLPAGEARRLEQLGVFLTTSAYSVFAYIWLLIIVMVWTPNVITITEAVLTMVFLVLLVVQAWLMDRFSGSASMMSYVTRVLDATGEEVMDPDDAAEKIDKLKSSGLKINKAMEAGRIASYLRPRSRAYYRASLMKSLKTGSAHSTKSASGNSTRSQDGEPPKAGSTEMKEIEVQVAEPEAPKSRRRSSTKTRKSSFFIRTEEARKCQACEQQVPQGTLIWKESIVSVWENCGTVELTVERVGGSQGEVSVHYYTKEQSATADVDYISTSGILTFADGETSKSIEVTIIDDDEFEKDEEFTVVLTEPTGGAKFDSNTDGKGDKEVCTVVILNDDEASGKLSEALALVSLFNRDNLRLARANYGQQIKDAFDQGEEPSLFDRIYFYLNLPWRILFALVPPPALCGGWPCFFGSLMGIGLQVVLISDFASQMGCQMKIKASVTAITFVALGTSLPDTFASMQAAREDKSADNSIGNVTGSNSVNVFFGLGLPWTLGAIYWAGQGATDEWKRKYPELVADYPDGGFVVLKGDLGFSVTVFTMCACTTIGVILFRRYVGGGELGGDRGFARTCAIGLFSLWILYVTLSTLSAYRYITLLQDDPYTVPPPSPPSPPSLLSVN